MIEVWKMMFFVAEAFCMGGRMFCDPNRKAHTVLSILSIVFGIIFILVA